MNKIAKKNYAKDLHQDLEDIQELIQIKKKAYKTKGRTDDLRDLDRLINLKCKIIEQIKRTLA